MAETDLYPPIKDFLARQGYTVKAEIHDCDVVAVRDDEPPVIVELKSTFSLQLVLQGIDRQAITDAVYLAFRPPKRRHLAEITKLCRRLGLGVLVVTGPIVEPLADPEPYRPRKALDRKGRLLKEFARRVGDLNLGGSARQPRMTAYRQDALRIAAMIGRSGPCKVADLRRQTGVGRTAGILQNDVYGWFQRESRGVYALSPKGDAALATFSAAIALLTDAPSETA